MQKAKAETTLTSAKSDQGPEVIKCFMLTAHEICPCQMLAFQIYE